MPDGNPAWPGAGMPRQNEPLAMKLRYEREAAMRYFTLLCSLMALMAVYSSSARAQDFDEDDPVPYDTRGTDYRESGRHFGAEFYPHDPYRTYQVGRRYDNRPPVRGSRSSRDYRYDRASNDRRGGYAPAASSRDYYDAYPRGRAPGVRPGDPDPFDSPYGRPRGAHYIAPDESNFRGGRYATDYPGFRGGWYGRDHRIRIRAGEYTADDFTNAYWEHQHRARSYPGGHSWNWISGQAH
jgi:hypothetical protein